MKRTPVTLKIKFKSETLEQFIERYAVDVSQGGIFIRTKEPLAVGTAMKFEFQLRDASPLIAGEGTVVWTRENDPSRPAIAPGMGVRFDRLADGSQAVLERILADKAKTSSRQSEATKPPMFNDSPTRVAASPFIDSPTRVAPIGLTENLRKSENDLATRKAPALSRDFDAGSDRTPLPQPMPFHSDADEFPEEAFEEQTKVRSLDELIAQTAEGGGTATSVLSDAGRRQPRADSTLAEPPMPEPAEPRKFQQETSRVPLQEPPARDSAPVLPLPPDQDPKPTLIDPDIERRAKDELAKPVRHDDPVTGPRRSSGAIIAPVVPAEAAHEAARAEAKAQIVETKAAARAEPAKPATKPLAKPAVEGPTTSSRIAATQPSTRLASSPPMAIKPSSGIGLIALIVVLVVVGAAGAVWYFVLRTPAGEEVVLPTTPGKTTTPPIVDNGSSGSNALAVGSDTGSAGSGGSAVAEVGSAGSAIAMTGSAGSSATPAGPMADTVIASNVEKAQVEIEGTALTGTAPFTAKVEKGKPFKAKVSAPGYLPAEIAFKGGDDKATAKLVGKPRVLTVTSEPAGAQILVEGSPTGKVTPADIELTKSQAARPRVRVTLRHAGFRSFDQVIDSATWTENADKLVATLDGKLVLAPVSRPVDTTPRTNSGSATPATGSGTGPTTTPTTTPTTPPDTTPKDTTPTTPTTPKDTTPTTPKDTTPKDTTPKDTTPTPSKDTTPKDTAPKSSGSLTKPAPAGGSDVPPLIEQ